MKKITVIIVLLLSISTLFAQVPDKVKVKFREKYPDMTATWIVLDNSQYAATFTRGGTENYIVYDASGNIISDDVVTVEYPVEIKTYYVKNYPDSKDYHVWVATDANGNKTYYVREHGYRIWFDKAGNFVRKETMKAKEEYKEEKKDLKDDDDDDD